MVSDTSAFAFGSFANLMIELDAPNNLFSYFIDDTLVGSVAANGSVEFSNAIVQGIHTFDRVDRTPWFDNFVASTGSRDTVAPIPVPAALPLLLLAIGGLAAVRRRARG